MCAGGRPPADGIVAVPMKVSDGEFAVGTEVAGAVDGDIVVDEAGTLALGAEVEDAAREVADVQSAGEFVGHVEAASDGLEKRWHGRAHHGGECVDLVGVERIPGVGEPRAQFGGGVLEPDEFGLGDDAAQPGPGRSTVAMRVVDEEQRRPGVVVGARPGVLLGVVVAGGDGARLAAGQFRDQQPAGIAAGIGVAHEPVAHRIAALVVVVLVAAVVVDLDHRLGSGRDLVCAQLRERSVEGEPGARGPAFDRLPEEEEGLQETGLAGSVGAFEERQGGEADLRALDERLEAGEADGSDHGEGAPQAAISSSVATDSPQ